MRADYDSEANAISIDLVVVDRWDYGEKVTDRVNVAIASGRPVNVELLYPTEGIEGPLAVTAERYDLDVEALLAAARAAFAAPDRPVTLEVGVRMAVA